MCYTINRYSSPLGYYYTSGRGSQFVYSSQNVRTSLVARHFFTVDMDSLPGYKIKWNADAPFKQSQKRNNREFFDGAFFEYSIVDTNGKEVELTSLSTYYQYLFAAYKMINNSYTYTEAIADVANDNNNFNANFRMEHTGVEYNDLYMHEGLLPKPQNIKFGKDIVDQMHNKYRFKLKKIVEHPWVWLYYPNGNQVSSNHSYYKLTGITDNWSDWSTTPDDGWNATKESVSFEGVTWIDEPLEGFNP